jgi:serine/threonine protein phosphatase 1
VRRLQRTGTGCRSPASHAAPDGQCVYAIGDVHGRRDLLEKLVEQIDEDSQSLPEGTKRVLVFLGDYIDRGLQSKDVIDFLLSDRMKAFERVFLMGNHEEALLRFLNDVNFGKQWVRYGGAETLYSYGLQPPPNARAAMQSHEAMQAYQRAWDKVWTEFRNRLPEDHLKFYQGLQHYHVAGDYLFVHAGLRPGEELEKQTVRDMLWIREEFLDAPRTVSSGCGARAHPDRCSLPGQSPDWPGYGGLHQRETFSRAPVPG